MKKLLTLGAFLWLCLGCEAILENDISNQTVVVLAPTENAQMSAGTISFHWQQIENASSYTVQIASPNFASATQILLDTNTSENTVSTDLTAGTYQWRVSASNSEYTTEYTTINFTVN